MATAKKKSQKIANSIPKVILGLNKESDHVSHNLKKFERFIIIFCRQFGYQYHIDKLDYFTMNLNQSAFSRTQKPWEKQ